MGQKFYLGKLLELQLVILPFTFPFKNLYQQRSYFSLFTCVFVKSNLLLSAVSKCYLIMAVKEIYL